MPNPTPGSQHVNRHLTDVSVGFLQSEDKYVADKVFPRIPVAKQSDTIATYNQGDFLRDEAERRGPGAAAARTGYRTGSTSYFCDEWDLEIALDDQVVGNADQPFSPKMDATRVLVQKMLIKREREFAVNFLSTGNIWTGSSDGADLVSGTDFQPWSNAASTPIEDVHNQQARIESETSCLPNKLVINRQGWFDLKNHPDIVDRVKHVSKDSITTAIVANLLGLDEVLVASAVHNTAPEGTAHNGSYIMGDNALLVHAAPSPGLMTPSGGYTFVWTGLNGSAEGQVIDEYREDRSKSDVVRITGAWAQKRIAPSLGVLFTNCSTRQ